jgi:hypothetical protein
MKYPMDWTGELLFVSLLIIYDSCFPEDHRIKTTTISNRYCMCSATAFSVVQSLRDMCHALNRTIIVSLLHPSPELMDLFDDVMILTDGRVVYQYVNRNPLQCTNLFGIMDAWILCRGAVRDAVPFFQEFGFICPPRVEVGSFLQEITTPLGQMEFASTDLLARTMAEVCQRRDALAARPPESLLVSVDQMSVALKSSEIGRSIDLDLDLEQARSKRSNGCPQMPQNRFANKALVLSFFVFRRHLLLMKREGIFISSRMVTNVSCGLFLGLFFSTVGLTGDPNPQQILAQGRKTIALITSASSVMVFIQVPLIASVFRAKSVLLKQRDQYLFPPVSYILAQTMEDMLVFMLESILFSATLYWLSGLTRAANNFFVFVLTNWSCMLSSSAIFRLVSITGSLRTVIVTIHQPSMEHFEAFDMLILLQFGGHLSYFGPLGDQSCDLVSYLESHPGVYPIKPGRNPATWMLEVTEASVVANKSSQILDFPEAFRSSYEYRVVLSQIDHLLRSLQDFCQRGESERDNPLLTQIREVLKIYLLFYWRAVDYNFTRMVMSIASALFCGFIYLGEGKNIHPGSDGAGIGTIQNVLVSEEVFWLKQKQEITQYFCASAGEYIYDSNFCE